MLHKATQGHAQEQSFEYCIQIIPFFIEKEMKKFT